jgi:hypothetical protein
MTGKPEIDDCRSGATLTDIAFRRLHAMTIKTVFAAAVLALVPALSQAACTGESHADQQAMTCADGTQWDAETATCLPVINS